MVLSVARTWAAVVIVLALGASGCSSGSSSKSGGDPWKLIARGRTSSGVPWRLYRLSVSSGQCLSLDVSDDAIATQTTQLISETEPENSYGRVTNQCDAAEVVNGGFPAFLSLGAVELNDGTVLYPGRVDPGASNVTLVERGGGRHSIRVIKNSVVAEQQPGQLPRAIRLVLPGHTSTVRSTTAWAASSTAETCSRTHARGINRDIKPRLGGPSVMLRRQVEAPLPSGRLRRPERWPRDHQVDGEDRDAGQESDHQAAEL